MEVGIKEELPILKFCLFIFNWEIVLFRNVNTSSLDCCSPVKLCSFFFC